jgi:ubiquinone/menaquinone biosynthesis C-methylase UbiE
VISEVEPKPFHMETLSLADIKKQVALLQIAERYFDSVVLFALFETGVFRVLSTGPKTLQEIHAHVRGNEESLRAALDAAVALGLLTLEGGRYVAGETILDCLGRENSAAYLGEWIAFLQALATPLMQLGEVIRTGKAPGTFFEEMEGDNSPAKRMTAAMDSYARTRGIELVDRVNFSTSRRFLDVGCGPGTYSMAIVERYPQVHATLLDLPGPIAEARQLAASRKMADRLEFVDTDAREFKPTESFDTVLVSNILHLIGPRDSVELLKRCYQWLSPGGRVIVQAQFLNDDRVSPRWPTLLNLTQRVASRNGRNHAITETSQWMQEAGFTNIEHVRFSMWNVNSCLVGERPA